MQPSSPSEVKERIHKVLAHAGVGSRRACEVLVAAGRVSVNGQPASIGQLVGPGDDIVVDGRPLPRRAERFAYYALNKPPGVVTSSKDERGRRTVVDLVCPAERVYPVGRLDAESEGLVLLTNDGELAYRLTHPRFGVRKIYRVTVHGRVGESELAHLREGIETDEGLFRVAGAELLEAGDAASAVRITLTEGHKRQIRRMCLAIGHPVVRLQRLAIGSLRLGPLGPGQWRGLTRGEVRALRRQVGLKEAS